MEEREGTKDVEKENKEREWTKGEENEERGKTKGVEKETKEIRERM